MYDHPQVTIYKKTDAYSHDRARDGARTPTRSSGSPPVQPGDAAQNGCSSSARRAGDAEAGGTWSDIFDPDNVINDHPLFFWLLAMEIAAFALVPLAIVGFRGLPDRGFLLTKPLGILVLSYLVYAPAALRRRATTRAPRSRRRSASWWPPAS